MDFNEHKPIYLQISDAICEKIIDGTLPPEERIPSVREYAASLGVNPNTVFRTYEYLESIDAIYNKRGVGFFVSIGAKDRIVSVHKRHFMEEELPVILKKMELLNIKPNDIFQTEKN